MVFRIIAAIIIGVIVVVRLASHHEKKSEYTNWLNEVKSKREYQTIDLNTLIQVYKSLGSEYFYTSDGLSSYVYDRKPRLLWYQAKGHGNILVDIPWSSYKKFMRVKQELDKRQDELDADIARARNSTNKMLTDAQSRLQDMIDRNLAKMKTAAEQQKEIIDRIQIVV